MAYESSPAGAAFVLPIDATQTVCTGEPCEQIYRDFLVVFNRLNYAMVIASSTLEIIWMNEAAARLFKKNDGMGLTRNYLMVERPETRQQVRSILRQFSAGSTGADYYCINVPRQHCRQPLHLVITPLGRNMPPAAEHTLCSMLLIFDPEMEMVADLGLIMRAYGLTAAESKVVVLLMQGKKLDQVAKLLVKKKETVRKQLGNIFAKTGTNRQSDLIRVLLRGPAGLL